VNAYTNHSINAHTAATSYVHLNSKWIGHAIASSTLSPAVLASADPVVARDNAERQVERMGEYGENETDVLGVPRQASLIPYPSLSSSSSSSSSSFSSFLFSPHEGL
jgi:diphthamide synthase (EF-2-diphthine--ammonia ligase)